MSLLSHHPLVPATALLIGTAAGLSFPVQPADRGPLDPCTFLTRQQVETVLPGHDGGMVIHSGGSLVAGVDAYQCFYSNQAADVFTVGQAAIAHL